jgi:hypothetical protein
VTMQTKRRPTPKPLAFGSVSFKPFEDLDSAQREEAWALWREAARPRFSLKRSEIGLSGRAVVLLRRPAPAPAEEDAGAPCDECGGDRTFTCSECGGGGRITCDYDERHDCRACEGTGDRACPACRPKWAYGAAISPGLFDAVRRSA